MVTVDRYRSSARRGVGFKRVHTKAIQLPRRDVSTTCNTPPNPRCQRELRLAFTRVLTVAEMAVRYMRADQDDVSTMELVGGPDPSAARTWILREGEWQRVQDILDRASKLLKDLNGGVPRRRKRG